MKLVIGVDFDGTFNADPETFQKIVKAFQAAGHEVLLISQRTEESRAEIDEVVGDLMPICLVGGYSKIYGAMALYDKCVDVWVEDNPAALTEPLRYVGPRSCSADKKGHEDGTG